ncbi:MAG: aldo/keto reductase [Anditalea sp.]
MRREPITNHLITIKHQATPAQVALSWGMARETAVIPKSVKEKRIRENLMATDLELDAEDTSGRVKVGEETEVGRSEKTEVAGSLRPKLQD